MLGSAVLEAGLFVGQWEELIVWGHCSQSQLAVCQTGVWARICHPQTRSSLELCAQSWTLLLSAPDIDHQQHKAVRNIWGVPPCEGTSRVLAHAKTQGVLSAHFGRQKNDRLVWSGLCQHCCASTYCLCDIWQRTSYICHEILPASSCCLSLFKFQSTSFS